MVTYKGISRFDKRKKRMSYSIKGYEGRKVVECRVFSDHGIFMRECFLLDFKFSTDPEHDLQIRKQIAEKWGLPVDEAGNYKRGTND